MDAKVSASATFDPQAAARAIAERISAHKPKAAAYALAELLKAIPVRTGAGKAAAGVEITDKGFELYIRKYYMYFQEKGWHVGARHTNEARTMRKLAKDIRSYRKLTGDESLKALESELRTRAKKINQANAAGRKWHESNHKDFMANAAKAAMPGVINILAGNDA